MKRAPSQRHETIYEQVARLAQQSASHGSVSENLRAVVKMLDDGILRLTRYRDQAALAVRQFDARSRRSRSTRTGGV